MSDAFDSHGRHVAGHTRWHRAAEQAVTGSGLSWTILRPGAFMSNTLSWAGMIRHQGRAFAPFTDVRTAAIDPADVAACAAAVLLEDGHDGQAYPLTGPEPVSARDQAAILGEVLGRGIGITEITPEAARQRMIQAGMPAEIADAVLATAAGAGAGPAPSSSPPSGSSPDVHRAHSVTGPPGTPPLSARGAP